MTPPARRAVQPHQARGLRGQAVRGHQLLLLAHCAGEAERVRAEAEQPDHRDQRQTQRDGGHHAQALAGAGPVPARPQHQERQREPGGDLDRDPRDQRGRATDRRSTRSPIGQQARVGAGCEQQRGGEREQQQRVVVAAADRELEQHRVQAHEGGGEAPRVAREKCPKSPGLLLRFHCNLGGGVFGHCFIPGRAAQQRDRGEAGGDRERLQRPQPTGEPERCDRVAAKREQGAVGRVLEGPAHEQEGGIRRYLGGDVRVRVHPVQGAQAGEIEVAEDVLGDQRRAQQQREVRGDDRHPYHPSWKRAHGEQHGQIARGHDQRERLEAVGAEAHAEAREGAGQPAGPAPAASGDILRRAARSAGGDE